MEVFRVALQKIRNVMEYRMSYTMEVFRVALQKIRDVTESRIARMDMMRVIAETIRGKENI